jgi:hypothetical protein
MRDILASKNPQDLMYNILVFFLYILILTFVLRYLWNSTLVKHITILRPVDSLLNTFLLSIGLSLFKL